MLIPRFAAVTLIIRKAQQENQNTQFINGHYGYQFHSSSSFACLLLLKNPPDPHIWAPSTVDKVGK